MHLPQLVQDLALILAAAAITTLLFRRLKQPVVLGYIIAGLLVGPHFSLLPTISDIESIRTWAEIGVIFLLFGLGLEFSFRKLARVGGTASITAITEVVVMVAVGYGAGYLLGWKTIDSIFLGGVLAISSTTIIIRAFDELGVKSKKFAGLVFGILVIEDLVAIVLLVLLSTLALSSQFSGLEMLYSISKLLLFLVIWFVAGIFFLPSLLRRWRAFMTDEMLLVTSLGLCLGMVALATSVGFSPALGAFMMGSILAETVVGAKIEHLTNSVKDLFGAVFFVSVGMLIEPAMMLQYLGPILLLTLLTIVFKTLSTTAGALISGQPLKQSIQAGMSLSQIGEFSFIIATLGLTLKVTSNFLYPIAVAVSAITTFTTPYMIRASGAVYAWVDRRLPPRMRRALERYNQSATTIRRTSDWEAVVRATLSQITIYALLIGAVILIIRSYALPALAGGEHATVLVGLATFFTVVLLLPVFWALSLRKIQPEAVQRLLENGNHRTPLVVLQVFRVAVALLLALYLAYSLLSAYIAIGILAIVAALVLFGRRRLQWVYDRIESRFLMNLNDRETAEKREAGHHLRPWDADIVSFRVPAGFSGLGRTLHQLQWREELGVNVVRIQRDGMEINAPQRDDAVFPADVLYLIGTDEQLAAFRAHIESQSAAQPQRKQAGELILGEILVNEASGLAGRSIRESGIREKTRGLIVGLERGDERLLNPESDMVLRPGDKLLVVGSARRIKAMADRK